MVAAEDERRLHVHHRVAGEHAVLQRLADPGLDRLDVFPGNHAADDLVLEDEARARLGRLQRDHHVAVLALAARLPDELALDVLDLLADGLAEGDLRLADVGLDLELALHAVDEDLEVQLAHAGDDRLAGLRVGAHPERRILFLQLLQRGGQLVLVGLGLRLDGDVDDRVGELHRLQDDRLVLVGQGVAGAGVLETDRRGDVAGEHFLDLVPLVGVHLEEPADPLPLVLGAVVDVAAALERAGVHPEEGEPADVRVGRHLEGERRERLGVRGAALDVGVVVERDVALDGRDVDRARQVVDDRVEQRLHALVLEGGPAEHRDDRARGRGLPDGPLNLVEGQLLAGEILRQQLVVVLHRRLDHLVPGRLDLLAVRLGHRHLGERLAQRLVVEDDLDPAQHVDVPGEHLAGAHRNLDRVSLLGEPVPDHGEAAIEVRPDAVHLVREDQPRHPVPVGLAPHRLGLRLHAGHRVEQRDGAVEHAQRALHLDGEVHVARGVDDVDAVQDPVAQPEAGRRGRGDRDAPLLLLLHPVHGGGALMDLTDLVVLARVIEDALGRSRLAGIDVGHDADVAVQLERSLTSHCMSSDAGTSPAARCPSEPTKKRGDRCREESRWCRSARIRAPDPGWGDPQGLLALSVGGSEVAPQGGHVIRCRRGVPKSPSPPNLTGYTHVSTLQHTSVSGPSGVSIFRVQPSP